MRNSYAGMILSAAFALFAVQAAGAPSHDAASVREELERSFPLAAQALTQSASTAPSSDVSVSYGVRYAESLVLTRSGTSVALRPIEGRHALSVVSNGLSSWRGAYRAADAFREQGGAPVEGVIARDAAALHEIGYRVAGFGGFSSVVRQGRAARFLSREVAGGRDLTLGEPLVVDAAGRRADRAWWRVENGSTDVASVHLAVDETALRFPVAVLWQIGAPERASALTNAAKSLVAGRRPATEATGSFGGRVTNAATGLPVQGVSVDVYLSDGEFVTSALSDANGDYVATGLGTGSYRALVTAFGFAAEMFDNIQCSPCNVTTGTAIAVTDGVHTPSISFALSEAGSRIRGTVVNTASEPLSLIVAAYDAAGAIVAAADTSETGAYELELPGSGSYFVRSINNRYPGYVDQLYAGIDCSGCDVTSGSPVVVGTGVVSNINLTLKTNGARIAGSVTRGDGSAVLEAEITVYNTQGRLVTFGYSDETGAYVTYHGLAAGSYHLMTRAADLKSEVYDDQQCTGSCNPTSGTPIVATLGSTITANVILANDVARVAGTVTDAVTGNPLGGVYVYFFDENGAPVLAASSSYEDGTFYLSLPAAGTYFARTFNSVHEGYIDQLFGGNACTSCDVTTGTPIDVGLTEVAGDIDFALSQSGGWISGSILDSAGQAMDGAYVIVYDANGSLITYGVSDAAGDYSIVTRLETGTYFAVGSADQHDSQLFDGISCASGCDPVSGTPIAVAAGVATTGVDFFLTEVGCSPGALSPDELPAGSLGGAYSQTITVSGLTAPITLALIEGALPDGLAFNPTTGVISGTPVSAGTFSFIIQAEGADGCNAARGYSIDVAGDPTSVTLTASPMSVRYGAPLTLTATVSPANATGQVDFLVDGVLAGSAALVAGEASVITTSLALGPHEAVASYRGGGTWAPSSSDVVIIEVTRGIPTITWLDPMPIVYGTALSGLQLNASALFINEEEEEVGISGTFEYSPPAGTILGAGTHILSTTFTADDQVSYEPAVATVVLVVEKGVQTIAWSDPAPIVYGTPLDATQLNATVTVSGPSAAGALSYTPAAGTVVGAGTHTLSVQAAETADYQAATAQVQLVVTKAEQTIVWADPADIVYGTPLSAVQLNATVDVVGPSPAGALTYTPAAGTLLTAGTHTLSVSAAATADYNPASASVTLEVLKATPVFSALTSPTIVFGTASVTLGGTIAAGTLIPPGVVVVTVNGVSQSASIQSDGSFSVSFASSGFAVGAYPVTYVYAGDANFNEANGTSVLMVTYGFTSDADPTMPHTAGSTIPIRFTLVDANGVNVSSPTITLSPYAIRLASGGPWIPVGDTFKYQNAQGGSYLYTLKTPKTLAPGTYELGFRASGDPVIHTVRFLIGH